MTMKKFWVTRMTPSNEETGQKWLWKCSHLLDSCFGEWRSLKRKRQIIFCAKTFPKLIFNPRLVFSEFTITMHASVFVIWLGFHYFIYSELQAQKSHIYLPNWTSNLRKTDNISIPKRILSFDSCGFLPLASFALWSGNAIWNE